jgi:hypothetical protein
MSSLGQQSSALERPPYDKERSSMSSNPYQPAGIRVYESGKSFAKELDPVIFEQDSSKSPGLGEFADYYSRPLDDM